MKHLVCLFIFLLGSAVCLGQFDFEQDALQGWTEVPAGRWETSKSDPLSGTGSLHHAFDNTTSGVDLIGRNLNTPDLTDTLVFSFRLRHGYPPSSSNNWQLFCLTDVLTDPGQEKTGSGIIFGVNFKGYDDRLKLWQFSGGQVAEILDSGIDYQADIGTDAVPFFRLTRIPGGTWSMEVFAGGSEDSLSATGNTTDDPVGYHVVTGEELFENHGKFMGFRYAYSPSQDRKLWIDDVMITGHFFRDSIPPEVTGLHVCGLNLLEITFSEAVSAYDPAGLQWNIRVPDSVDHIGNRLYLYYETPFPNRIPQQLRVSGIADAEGNMAGDTVVSFMQDLAEYGDIVISELMTDPEPEIYLPPCEYIELFNRYTHKIDLTGWRIIVNERVHEIPATGLDPGEFLLLTHYGCEAAYNNVRVIGNLSSSSALPNSGAAVRLTDHFGRPVHKVEYDDYERYDNHQSEGGWSLERADPDDLCGGMDNWRMSDDRQGGSPGRSNSTGIQYTDHAIPSFRNMGVRGDTVIALTFDEELLLEKEGEAQCMLNGNRLVPPKGPYPLVTNTLEFATEHPLVTGRDYELVINDVADCAGNMETKTEINFRLPSTPGSGHPVLSEVMYDPAPGGNEFIELWNHGTQFYDLRDLVLQISSSGSTDPTRIFISENSRIIFPDEFVVLTRRDYALRDEWGLEESIAVHRLKQWRSLADQGGCISLTDRSGKAIDQFCYHDSLHHDLLGITAGVSLERLYPGVCDPPESCWSSAATSAGYGTPGSSNSRFYGESTETNGLFIDPKVFSPDGNGTDDFMRIMTGSLPQEGAVDLLITDLNGIHVYTFVSRGIGGSADTFSWDGTDQAGRIVRPGLYVVHLRISGKKSTQTERAVCAVTYR